MDQFYFKCHFVSAISAGSTVLRECWMVAVYLCKLFLSTIDCID